MVNDDESATPSDPDPRCDICGSRSISAGGGCLACHEDYAPGHGLGEDRPESDTKEHDNDD